MTQMDLFQTATSSQPDIRANHFHLPGSEEAQKMTDISGLSFLPLLKASDPLFAFSKMFMGMSLWGSTKCYLTWRGKATPQGRSLFQLVPRTHLTDEIDSGSSVEMWPTPTTQDNPQVRGIGKTVGTKRGTTLGGAVRMWPTPLAQEAKHGQVTQWEMETDHAATKNSLRVAVAKQMWPTPQARDYKGPSGRSMKGTETDLPQAVKMYPTPTASLEKHSTKEAYWENRIQKGRQEDIQMRVYKETGSGSLNPQWVEWLMGYPEGWTDLEV